MTTSTQWQTYKHSFCARWVILGVFVLIFFAFPVLAFGSEVKLEIAKVPQVAGTLPIFVSVDSFDQETIGSDILLNYDRSVLEYESVVFAQMYTNQHQARHNQQKSEVRFSGNFDYQSYEPVSGVMAVAYFYLKDPSVFAQIDEVSFRPPLELIWQKDATNDTNVVSIDGADLLSTAPRPLAVNLDLLEGEVQGILSEAQVLGLENDGVIAQATQARLGLLESQSFRWILLIIILSIILWLLFLKRRKRRK